MDRPPDPSLVPLFLMWTDRVFSGVVDRRRSLESVKSCGGILVCYVQRGVKIPTLLPPGLSNALNGTGVSFTFSTLILSPEH